jgi:hypothetical protein
MKHRKQLKGTDNIKICNLFFCKPSASSDVEKIAAIEFRVIPAPNTIIISERSELILKYLQNISDLKK